MTGTLSRRARQPNSVMLSCWYCVEAQPSSAMVGHGEARLTDASVIGVNRGFSCAHSYPWLYLWNIGSTGTSFVDDVKVVKSQT